MIRWSAGFFGIHAAPSPTPGSLSQPSVVPNTDENVCHSAFVLSENQAGGR